MYEPSFAEFEKLAQSGNLIPVYQGNISRFGNAGFRFNETPK